MRRPRNSAPEVCAQPARTSLLTHVQRRAVTHRLVMTSLNIAHYAPLAQPMQLEACGSAQHAQRQIRRVALCGALAEPLTADARVASECSGCRSDIAVHQHPQHLRNAALAPLHRFADDITCSCSVTAASTKHRRAAWGPCAQASLRRRRGGAHAPPSAQAGPHTKHFAAIRDRFESVDEVRSRDDGLLSQR